MKGFDSFSLLDCSTACEFCFSFRCEECGEEWKSTPVKFSYAGRIPPSEEKEVVFSALYEREREAARRTAVEKAAASLNVCPVCGRMVCDKCFLICEDIDMCRSCAEKLKETGEPVLSLEAPRPCEANLEKGSA